MVKHPSAGYNNPKQWVNSPERKRCYMHPSQCDSAGPALLLIVAVARARVQGNSRPLADLARAYALPRQRRTAACGCPHARQADSQSLASARWPQQYDAFNERVQNAQHHDCSTSKNSTRASQPAALLSSLHPAGPRRQATSSVTQHQSTSKPRARSTS